MSERIRFGSPSHFAMLEDRMAKLYAIKSAAERVCWYDWSENDADAVAAVDALRRALSRAEPVPERDKAE